MFTPVWMLLLSLFWLANFSLLLNRSVELETLIACVSDAEVPAQPSSPGQVHAHFRAQLRCPLLSKASTPCLPALWPLQHALGWLMRSLSLDPSCSTDVTLPGTCSRGVSPSLWVVHPLYLSTWDVTATKLLNESVNTWINPCINLKNARTIL